MIALMEDFLWSSISHKSNATTEARLIIDHFTVVRSVTWPLDGSEAGVDLVLILTSLLLLCKTTCSDANEVHVHDKCNEVCIKTRSTPVSLPSKGQVTEQITLKLSISISIHPCHTAAILDMTYVL